MEYIRVICSNNFVVAVVSAAAEVAAVVVVLAVFWLRLLLLPFCTNYCYFMSAFIHKLFLALVFVVVCRCYCCCLLMLQLLLLLLLLLFLAILSGCDDLCFDWKNWTCSTLDTYLWLSLLLLYCTVLLEYLTVCFVVE